MPRKKSLPVPDRTLTEEKRVPTDVVSCLAGILNAEPKDGDTPRLALADALEEAGHAALAQKVRFPPVLLVVNDSKLAESAVILVHPNMRDMVEAVDGKNYQQTPDSDEDSELLFMMLGGDNELKVPKRLGTKIEGNGVDLPAFCRLCTFTK